MLCLPKIVFFALLAIFFSQLSYELPTALAEEKKEEKVNSSEADSFIETKNYVHNWVTLPKIEGYDLAGNLIKQSPQRGVLDVIIFIASWCIQCQQLIGYIQDLESRYLNKNTRFTYIFSHDLKSDALGFSKAFKINSAIIASHKILKAYHNPELPSIYIGDRHGWLLARYLKVTPKELKKVDEVISYLTAY
ncbi:MAG: TlpA family protein disulfide reductase [Oligoflexales bacterium]